MLGAVNFQKYNFFAVLSSNWALSVFSSPSTGALVHSTKLWKAPWPVAKSLVWDFLPFHFINSAIIYDPGVTGIMVLVHFIMNLLNNSWFVRIFWHLEPKIENVGDCNTTGSAFSSWLFKWSDCIFKSFWWMTFLEIIVVLPPQHISFAQQILPDMSRLFSHALLLQGATDVVTLWCLSVYLVVCGPPPPHLGPQCSVLTPFAKAIRKHGWPHNPT